MMHTSLYVTDLERTIDFYTRFFQCPPTKVQPGYAKWELPEVVISFVENPDRVQAGFGHMGFRVGSSAEVLRRMEAARAAGLAVTEEMGVNCCYAVQDKFWVADPDGVQWEVYVFHEDSAFHDPRYTTPNATNCCIPATKQKVSLRDLRKAD